MHIVNSMVIFLINQNFVMADKCCVINFLNILKMLAITSTVPAKD